MLKMRLYHILVMSCLLLVIQTNISRASRTALRGHHRSLVKPKHPFINVRTNLTAGATEVGTATTVATASNHLKLGALTEKMYNHCQDIFKEKNLVSHVIRGMIGGILDRLNEVCLDKPIHPMIHRIFTEILLCGGSLSDAVDSITDIIFGNFERKCRDRIGFRSVYVLTSAENEVMETKHIK
ncbi:uncharacterized protein LOC108031161 [Drosophila biarmipes]|uniref:uncharacterized protein LOC108031161 n=1 Tax=Drosophila biarmipes TaxID=125945 RepID=UPI0007E6E851|nr:uncharacterized protein LOC108031161 [Drosophila biarmipes]